MKVSTDVVWDIYKAAAYVNLLYRLKVKKNSTLSVILQTDLYAARSVRWSHFFKLEFYGWVSHIDIYITLDVNALNIVNIHLI